MDRLVDRLVPQLRFTMAIFAEQLDYDELVKRCIKFEHKFLQKSGAALDFHQNSGLFPAPPAFSVPVPYMAHPITGPLQMLPEPPEISAASQIPNSAPGGTSNKIRVPNKTEKADTATRMIRLMEAMEQLNSTVQNMENKFQRFQQGRKHDFNTHQNGFTINHSQTEKGKKLFICFSYHQPGYKTIDYSERNTIGCSNNNEYKRYNARGQKNYPNATYRKIYPNRSAVFNNHIKTEDKDAQRIRRTSNDV
jgi:hypothetical protein